MGGGGSKTSTTDSGVPNWAKPYLKGAAKDATKLYDKGRFDNVAGLTASAGAAGQIASDMSSAEVQAQRNSAMGGANAGLNAYSNLAASGQAKQDQIQAQQDAQYQGIQRLFGLINPGTVGSVQNTTSTGGK